MAPEFLQSISPYLTLPEQALGAIDIHTPLVLGIASDSGSTVRSGSNEGPLLIRNKMQKFTSVKYRELGDIKIIPQLLHDKYLNEETISQCRKFLYGDANRLLPVAPLSLTKQVCEKLWHENFQYKLLSLGGDHSVSIPLVSAWLQSRQLNNISAAVIHFDTGPDLLPQHLGLDICASSWARHILDQLPHPSLLVQLGISSGEHSQEYWQDQFGIHQYWAQEFRQKRLDVICTDIISHLKTHAVQELYISCDIQVLSAPGLGPHEIIYIISELAQKFKISAGDLVEMNPFIPADKSLNPEPHTTLSSAAMIADCLLEVMNSCQ